MTLTLIGDGRDRPVFEQLARQLRLDAAWVRFLGSVPNAEALRMLGEAQAGVIPHHADDSWNSTIPNKLFDYMAAGLVVVASDAAPVKRVVMETGCGVTFKDRDPVDLARAIEQLREPARREQYRNAGRAAIATRYNWEHDTAALLTAIDNTVGQPLASNAATV